MGVVGFNFPWYSQKSHSAVCLSEFLGTFALCYVIGLCVTVGTSSVATPIAIAGAIFCLCNVFGESSGAHFNPCITIPIWLVDRRFSGSRCILYLISETCGAIVGAQVATWTGNKLQNPFSWATHAANNYSLVQIIVCECIFTCVLALTALKMGFLQPEPNPLCPAWVAGAVVAASYAGGPISGACINPSIAVGWVVAEGELQDLIPYFVGPMMGALAAAAIVMLMDPEIYQRRFGPSLPEYKEHIAANAPPEALVMLSDDRHIKGPTPIKLRQ